MVRCGSKVSYRPYMKSPHDDNGSPDTIEYKCVLISRPKAVRDGCKFQFVPQPYKAPTVRARSRPNEANHLHGWGRLHFTIFIKHFLHFSISIFSLVLWVGRIQTLSCTGTRNALNRPCLHALALVPLHFDYSVIKFRIILSTNSDHFHE
jgi:hypothetical protein